MSSLFVNFAEIFVSVIESFVLFAGMKPLWITFVLLLTISFPTDIRSAQQDRTQISKDSEPLRKEFTSNKTLVIIFFLETLAVAAGDHVIKGPGFDIPNKEYQEVAEIFGNMYSLLPITKKLTEILSSACGETAKNYTEAADKEKAHVYKVHYNGLKCKIEAIPELNELYTEERKKLRDCDLPPLKNGRIHVENIHVRIVRDEMENMLWTNEKFRKLFIITRFIQYAMLGLRVQVYEDADFYDRALTANAIVTLSRRSETGKETQKTYNQALDEVSVKLARQRNMRKVDQMMFSIISEKFKQNKYLHDQLQATKQDLLKMNA